MIKIPKKKSTKLIKFGSNNKCNLANISKKKCDKYIENIFNKVIKNFKKGKKIGEGGFGEVYEYINNAVIKKVKIQKQDCTNIDQLLIDIKDNIIGLRNEIEILGKLDNKNVIKIFDYNINQFDFKKINLELEKTKSDINKCHEYMTNILNETYIVYERGDIVLNKYIKALKTASVEEMNKFINVCSNISKQFFDITKYLSSNNITHNDIKEDNFVLVFENNKIIVKIIDFGLAYDLNNANNKILKRNQDTEFNYFFNRLVISTKFIDNDLYKLETKLLNKGIIKKEDNSIFNKQKLIKYDLEKTHPKKFAKIKAIAKKFNVNAKDGLLFAQFGVNISNYPYSEILKNIYLNYMNYAIIILIIRMFLKFGHITIKKFTDELATETFNISFLNMQSIMKELFKNNLNSQQGAIAYFIIFLKTHLLNNLDVIIKNNYVLKDLTLKKVDVNKVVKKINQINV